MLLTKHWNKLTFCPVLLFFVTWNENDPVERSAKNTIMENAALKVKVAIAQFQMNSLKCYLSKRTSISIKIYSPMKSIHYAECHISELYLWINFV